ncbi:uncharacterized protein K489DRAFT_372213 [Dissoconium aciculare CBS 342.82]|uniref:Uncharacterized protein n=1 Tax=Dissoconium aciculare CBS 342.82 TaxID=1314786 RepID=A0A6J3M044_9PEZI|nr:uncharacterized protein K489DRAFT_372213 [Dissoconium aciculare CBS 342.82]KAF1821298.1 hypothetical protein K489DRAFT_372213 [Dissoconium aciculare CBS 342.82]
MFRYLKECSGVDNRRKIVDILNQKSSWLVAMRTVVTHAPSSYVAHTELHDLLGNATVQMVEATEIDRIDAMYTLAEEYELGNGVYPLQNLVRPSANELEAELQSLITKKNRILPGQSLKSKLQPAIIFRLCPSSCNRPGGKHYRPRR